MTEGLLLIYPIRSIKKPATSDQAIHELRHGSVNEAKQLLARQIAVLANVLMVL